MGCRMYLRMLTFICVSFVVLHQAKSFRLMSSVDKRNDLCTLHYMDNVQLEENLIACSHGSYIDKCGNERCFKGHGEKCGHFPGASHTQLLLWGKCDHCYFCSGNGICQGIHNPKSRCYHHDQSHSENLASPPLKRDPEFIYDPFFFPLHQHHQQQQPQQPPSQLQQPQIQEMSEEKNPIYNKINTLDEENENNPLVNHQHLHQDHELDDYNTNSNIASLQ